MVKSQLSKASVTVVGDAMLDTYTRGSAHRLSPEAPVPVLTNLSQSSSLGGAANAAANVASLGAEVAFVGCVGDDAAGHAFLELCEIHGVTFRGEVVNGYLTPTKHRILSGTQHVVRLDSGDKLQSNAAAGLLDNVAFATAGTILISDYAKGTVTPSSAKAIIDYASSAGIEVVVDSKNTDYSVFRGSTCVTPNLIESQLASGESDPNEAARKLHSQTNAMVLVTMGAEGMMLFDGANFITLDAASQEVFDVTGAGDTVAAAIAVRLAEGADIHSAVSWANRAAAVAVSHRGTYAVLRSEVPDA